MRPKYLVGTALAVLLTVGACMVPASAVRAEVAWWEEPASWALEQMEDLVDGGIIGQGVYDPTGIMTRGQFCYFMVNIVQREGQRELLSAVSPMPVDYFDDVTSTDGLGGRQNVYTAAAYGLTEGALVGGRRLAQLNDVLTREQAAKMMCSLLDALGRYTGLEDDRTGTPRAFVDGDAISPWAREYVDRASALGILKGDERGRFDPQGVLTFQEACVMLDRAFLQGEEAAVERDEALGIQSLATALEEDTDWILSDKGNRLYYMENETGRAVLRICGSSTATSGIQVERFDEGGDSLGIREIPVELSFCAAFYEGEKAYYLAFGQSNMEENDRKEVYRIVKYDQSWNRLGAASVNGGESYTTFPYRSTTHTGMAEDNGTLVLHTARLRYQNAKGERHQSNITIQVRTSDMSVLSVSPHSPGNHVSHSFAQYVVFDGGEPVYADQGDAYPRGFALNWDMPVGYGKELNFFPFAGELGDNTTNAIPGGLGVSDSHYLFAGASSDQKGNDELTYCNAFLAVASKAGYPDNSRVEIQWLTNYPKDGKEYVSDVKLVPLDRDTFVVMWQTIRQDDRTIDGAPGDFCYAVFDGRGEQIGRTQVKENFVAPLNDPAVSGDRILWVRPEIGPYSVFMNSTTRYLKRYELEIEPNKASVVAPQPTETPKPVEPSGPSTGDSTRLPADGVTDCYRSAWGDGQWMEIRMVDEDTIRLSGCMPDLPDYYNYVVLRAYQQQAEAPFVPGEAFEVEVTFDAEGFKRTAVPGQYSYISALVCQNHRPGDRNLVGLSFQDGERISLTLDDAGKCMLWILKD